MSHRSKRKTIEREDSSLGWYLSRQENLGEKWHHRGHRQQLGRWSPCCHGTRVLPALGCSLPFYDSLYCACHLFFGSLFLFSLSLMHEGSQWRCQGMFTPCSKCLPLPATSLSLLKPISSYYYNVFSLFVKHLFIWCGVCVWVLCVICECVFRGVWVNMFVHAFRGQRSMSAVSLNHFWKQELFLNMQIIIG